MKWILGAVVANTMMRHLKEVGIQPVAFVEEKGPNLGT